MRTISLFSLKLSNVDVQMQNGDRLKSVCEESKSSPSAAKAELMTRILRRD
jgi:hypothetical protein